MARAKRGVVVGMDPRYVRFVRWQWFLAGCHFAAAAAVGVLVARGDDWKVPVHLTFNVWKRQGGSNECTEASPCVLTENRAVLPHHLSLGTAATTFSVFSGTHHLAIALFPAHSRCMIASGVNTFRWFDYAWSSSLMLAVNSVLWVAPPDLQGFVNWFAVQFLVILAGYGSEVAWSASQRFHSVALFAGACLAYAAVWSTAWAAFVVSTRGHDGTVRVGGQTDGDVATNSPPDLVYALLVWLCGSFLLFPAVHCAKLAAAPETADMLLYEVWYSFLSLFSKIPLLSVFASGIIGRSDRTTLSALPDDYVPDEDEGTSRTTLMVLGSAAAFCALVGIVLVVDLVVLERGIVASCFGGAARRPKHHPALYHRMLLFSVELHPRRG